MYKTTTVVATTAAVGNRLVASTNMKVGAYTVANGGVPVWPGGFKVTCTNAADTADTMGTVAFVGKDLHGFAITDTLTPVADTVVTGTKIFSIVTSITGAGWVIAGNNDTITCGVAADSYAAVGGGHIKRVIVDVLHATAFTLSDSSGVLATYPASLPVGTYDLEMPYSGFLKIATTNANGIRVVHTPGVPTTYALA